MIGIVAMMEMSARPNRGGCKIWHWRGASAAAENLCKSSGGANRRGRREWWHCNHLFKYEILKERRKNTYFTVTGLTKAFCELFPFLRPMFFLGLSWKCNHHHHHHHHEVITIILFVGSWLKPNRVQLPLMVPQSQLLSSSSPTPTSVFFPLNLVSVVGKQWWWRECFFLKCGGVNTLVDHTF